MVGCPSFTINKNFLHQFVFFHCRDPGMYKTSEIHQRLIRMKSLLDRVARSWTGQDYEDLMHFFVETFPTLMNAERCSIFIANPNSQDIWLKFGTGLKEKEIVAPLQGSLVGESITSGETIFRSDLDTLNGFHVLTGQQTEFITRNLLCVPIQSLVEERYIGAVQVLNKKDQAGFSEQDEHFLRQVVKYMALSIEHNAISEEIIHISKGMHDEIARSSRKLVGKHRFVAESRNMRQVLEVTRQVGPLPVNVFITGESGTGKELIARMVHEYSGDRRTRPFVAINCSAIPENLMESEFFGYEKGAFTGAAVSHMGRFEEATGGTLFLDEITDMPLSIQPKFLRAIQELEGSRLGGSKVHNYQFRIVSASRKDLRGEVEKGHFREDLFFRLFSVDIHIPPLRERQEDILPLALMFLEEVCHRFKKKVTGFSRETLALFESHRWPGNVRQLQHEVERLVALTPNSETISEKNCSMDLLLNANTEKMVDSLDSLSLPVQKKRLEIRLIRTALQKSGGNKNNAAQLLEITRQSLHNKIRLHQIQIKD